MKSKSILRSSAHDFIARKVKVVNLMLSCNFFFFKTIFIAFRKHSLVLPREVCLKNENLLMSETYGSELFYGMKKYSSDIG